MHHWASDFESHFGLLKDEFATNLENSLMRRLDNQIADTLRMEAARAQQIEMFMLNAATQTKIIIGITLAPIGIAGGIASAPAIGSLIKSAYLEVSLNTSLRMSIIDGVAQVISPTGLLVGAGAPSTYAYFWTAAQTQIRVGMTISATIKSAVDLIPK